MKEVIFTSLIMCLSLILQAGEGTTINVNLDDDENQQFVSLGAPLEGRWNAGFQGHQFPAALFSANEVVEMDMEIAFEEKVKPHGFSTSNIAESDHMKHNTK